jgi:hypothetical protein
MSTSEGAIFLEIPELEIKNSRLADKVIRALQSEDKFDVAHKLVAIADESIRNQTTRDVIDLAIEMARAPCTPLRRSDYRKLKRLLLAAKKELEKINNKSLLLITLIEAVEDIIRRIPKTVPEMVLEKLQNGEVLTPPPLSSYWVRFVLFRLQHSIATACKIIPEKNAERLRETFGEIGKIVGFPLKEVG